MRHDMHRAVAHRRSCDCHGVRPRNSCILPSKTDLLFSSDQVFDGKEGEDGKWIGALHVCRG